MSRKSDNHHWETFLGRRPIESMPPESRRSRGQDDSCDRRWRFLGSALALKIASSAPQLVLCLKITNTTFTKSKLSFHALLTALLSSQFLGTWPTPIYLSPSLAQYRPEIVYHAAAFKHVPLMEANPLPASGTIRLELTSSSTLSPSKDGPADHGFNR